jgi:nucleoside-diphosphate-sugar epimerase
MPCPNINTYDIILTIGLFLYILILPETPFEAEIENLTHCHTLVIGGTGLIGTFTREALGNTDLNVATISRTPPEDLRVGEQTIQLDLSTATVEQLEQILIKLKPERIIYLAAWTDVKSAIALSQIYTKFPELKTNTQVPINPISQINIGAMLRLCSAIHLLPEAIKKPEIVIASTTFSTIKAVRAHNWYAYTKFMMSEIGLKYNFEFQVRKVLFGYPYSTRTIESSRAKNSTLRWWINKILEKIDNPPQEDSDKLTPFNYDAVDHTNIHHVIRSILQLEYKDFPRGWLTTAQVAEIIIEEYCKLKWIEDAKALKKAILNPVSGDTYKPTVGKLLATDNPVYQWLEQAAKAQGIDLEELLALEVDYARAYPKATDSDITMSNPNDLADPYVIQLRADISQIIQNILETK